ncbi:S-methyl-5-thioribose-1-phosphate isomerase [Lithohypha guttulata]|nr:S-methyl-5-thioribose-1-phosphate isomerase [Lithohypha guttulata]
MVLEAIKYTPASGAKAATLQILNQLLLPHQSTYIEIKTCEDGFDAVKQMKVRGAPAIAIVAALSLATELSQPNYSASSASSAKDHIIGRLQYLKKSRPTAVNLGDAVGKLSKIVTEAAAAQEPSDSSVVEAYISAAERMLIDDVSDNKAIGANGAKWIIEHTDAGKLKGSDKTQELEILTICNTGSLATAGYGTALGVIRSLREGGFLTRAYACETRPYNQGSRLTAYELVHDQIPATLITDSMAGALLARKDLDTASGQDITIEERAPQEVTRVQGPTIDTHGNLSETVTINIAADGIDVWNPAFDVTPADLIDGVITEVGVVEKENGIFNFQPLFANTTEATFETRPSTIGGM